MSKKFSKKQKLYKMVGCSKKTRKNHLGGSTDTPLAYTGKSSFSFPNPYLAYTGKGGSSCALTSNTNMPTNTNAANPTLPNTGPVSAGANTIFNNGSTQRGGCGGMCSATSVQSGGSCGCGGKLMMGGSRKKKGGICSICGLGLMMGGTKHRVGCKCSTCKKRKVIKGGNPGIPYPDGLVGTPWTSSVGGWPGVNGIPGDSNYYSLNTYNNDVSRQIVDVGANPPFLNMKAGKRKQKGGTLSNFLGQDLINLGRQFQFGMGSAYNALAGYSAPVNPMPWRDQFPSKLPFNPATI